jgi:hypothetical protein
MRSLVADRTSPFWINAPPFWSRLTAIVLTRWISARFEFWHPQQCPQKKKNVDSWEQNHCFTQSLVIVNPNSTTKPHRSEERCRAKALTLKLAEEAIKRLEQLHCL